MEQVNICTIFNALPRVTVKFLKKKYTATFLYEIDGNALKLVQLYAYTHYPFKMHCNMNINQSDFAQKIIIC